MDPIKTAQQPTSWETLRSTESHKILQKNQMWSYLSLSTMFKAVFFFASFVPSFISPAFWNSHSAEDDANRRLIKKKKIQKCANNPSVHPHTRTTPRKMCVGIRWKTGIDSSRSSNFSRFDWALSESAPWSWRCLTVVIQRDQLIHSGLRNPSVRWRRDTQLVSLFVPESDFMRGGTNNLVRTR